MTDTVPPASEVPDWFVSAVGQQPQRHCVDVDGMRIAYRAWGPAGAPVVVLVHGGAAHAGWWDHVAPLLGRDRRIVAVDLSGHGDSDQRPEYTLESWAQECLQVAAAEGDAPPTLVGHSLGGFVALTAAQHGQHPVRRTVVIDSSVTAAALSQWSWLTELNLHAVKHYGSRDEILSRFRTLPEDTASKPYILAHVAAQSVRPTPRGWRWKYDPRIFDRPPWDPACLADHRGPLAMILAERGTAPTDVAAHTLQLVPGSSIEVVADAGHHVMLDQPRRLVELLNNILSGT